MAACIACILKLSCCLFQVLQASEPFLLLTAATLRCHHLGKDPDALIHHHLLSMSDAGHNYLCDVMFISLGFGPLPFVARFLQVW